MPNGRHDSYPGDAKKSLEESLLLDTEINSATTGMTFVQILDGLRNVIVDQNRRITSMRLLLGDQMNRITALENKISPRSEGPKTNPT